MILKLIRKDLIAYKNQIFFRTLIPMLFVTNIFNIRFYEWDVYFMMACMVISVSFSSFYFIDKKSSAEQLTLSLPTTRTNIVVTRYLLSIIIAAIGIFLFYLNAYIAEFIHTNPVTHFMEINNVKVLLLTLLFISLVITIFLPASLTFRFMGSIMSFILAIVLAAFLVAFIFKPWSMAFRNKIEFWQGLAIIIFIILIIASSLRISLFLFNWKDM